MTTLPEQQLAPDSKQFGPSTAVQALVKQFEAHCVPEVPHFPLLGVVATGVPARIGDSPGSSDFGLPMPFAPDPGVAVLHPHDSTWTKKEPKKKGNRKSSKKGVSWADLSETSALGCAVPVGVSEPPTRWRQELLSSASLGAKRVSFWPRVRSLGHCLKPSRSSPLKQSTRSRLRNGSGGIGGAVVVGVDLGTESLYILPWCDSTVGGAPV